jgi:hypothetical protein
MRNLRAFAVALILSVLGAFTILHAQSTVGGGVGQAGVASAANQTASPNGGVALLAAQPAGWAIFSAPAVSTQASASQAAGAAGVRHVATNVCFSAGSTTAPALTQLTVNLRDGATGAGTIKWSQVVIVTAVVGQNAAPVCTPVNVVGSAATAMTLEYSALLTNLFEAVSVQGYDIQ